MLKGPFHSLWKQAYTPGLVLQSLWRSGSITPDLPRLFWEPGMVLVKDCEVKTSPFISVVSSSRQLPRWRVFADKPWRSCAGCCDPALPASKQQGVTNLQDIKDCFFRWMVQPSTRQLGYIEPWEWCREGISWRPSIYSTCLRGSLNGKLLNWNNRKSTKQNMLRLILFANVWSKIMLTANYN